MLVLDAKELVGGKLSQKQKKEYPEILQFVCQDRKWSLNQGKADRENQTVTFLGFKKSEGERKVVTLFSKRRVCFDRVDWLFPKGKVNSAKVNPPGKSFGKRLKKVSFADEGRSAEEGVVDEDSNLSKET